MRQKKVGWTPNTPMKFFDLFGFSDLLWFIGRRWKKLTCRHPAVGVIRYNAKVVPAAWKGRELYVDKYACVCFVQCFSCDRVFQGKQRERLYGQEMEEFVVSKTAEPE